MGVTSKICRQNKPSLKSFKEILQITAKRQISQ